VYLGILGIIAGLMILYGGFKDKRDFVIARSAIGVATPTEFAILSLIGGLIQEKEKVKS